MPQPASTDPAPPPPPPDPADPSSAAPATPPPPRAIPDPPPPPLHPPPRTPQSYPRDVSRARRIPPRAPRSVARCPPRALSRRGTRRHPRRARRAQSRRREVFPNASAARLAAFAFASVARRAASVAGSTSPRTFASASSKGFAVARTVREFDPPAAATRARYSRSGGDPPIQPRRQARAKRAKLRGAHRAAEPATGTRRAGRVVVLVGGGLPAGIGDGGARGGDIVLPGGTTRDGATSRQGVVEPDAGRRRRRHARSLRR